MTPASQSARIREICATAPVIPVIVIEDAAVEMDEAKRSALLQEANALVAKDRPRLAIVSVGSAWAMQKD